MAHKKKHRKKNAAKPETYTDEHGIVHLVIKPGTQRNEMHFQHQLHNRAQVIESKKHKPAKHKKKLFDED